MPIKLKELFPSFPIRKCFSTKLGKSISTLFTRNIKKDHYKQLRYNYYHFLLTLRNNYYYFLAKFFALEPLKDAAARI